MEHCNRSCIINNIHILYHT